MTIPALPALDRTSPGFRDATDLFFGTQLPAFSVGAEAARIEINANTVTASSAATTATTGADTATQQAQISTTKALESAASAVSATAAAALAAGSAVLAGLPPLTAQALKILRVNEIGAALEWTENTSTQLAPTLNAPAQATPNNPVNITFTGTTTLVGQSIASFEITWFDGSKQTVIASGNAGSASKVVTGAIGQTKTVSIKSTDTLGNISKSTSKSFLLVANNAPTGTLVISAPTQVAKLSTGNQISFSGISDPDAGDSVSYVITSSGLFTFAKTTGITGGEIVTFTAPDVTVDTASTVSVKAVDTRGGETAVSSTTITIKALNITGVVLKSTGGNGGTWGHIDKDGNDITSPSLSTFNATAPWSGIVDQTIDGQAMVKIPKFYYKTTTIATGVNAGKTAWWIADAPTTGYTLHPSFMNAGLVIDQFWYGKYQASLQTTKLASVAGVLPAVSRSLTQFIADASARNVGGVTGFMLHSFWQWSVVQFLYLVENKTMDSQTKTGLGRTDPSNTAAANVDATDVATASYRGMVGLWGNVYQWMDGLRTTTGSYDVWDINGNKTFASTGQTTGADASRYPLTFISAGSPTLAAGFIANTFATTSTAATAPDQQYFGNSGTYYPFIGGAWSDGAGAGLWYVYCYYAPSIAHTDIGARLAKV